MTTYIVQSGVTSTGITLDPGDVMTVFGGGTAIDITVDSGGLLENDGVATGTVVNSGGTEGIYGLRSAGGTAITLGGMIDLYYIEPATVVSASLDPSTDLLTIYQSGGTLWQQQLSGNYTNAHVQVTADSLSAVDNGQGTLLTLVPGPASVSSGSTYYVSAGQTTVGTVVYGTQTVLAGGTTDSGTVSSGGIEIVEPGGVANSTMVGYGGEQDVDGGTVSATAVVSGVEIVAAGGTASSTTVGNGTLTVESGGMTVSAKLYGTEYVQSGGTANATTISSEGTEYLYPGAIANGVTVDYGGTLIIAGANPTGIVNSGGNVFSGSAYVVGFGEVSSGLTLSVADIEYVSSGGEVLKTFVSGGQMLVFSSGTDSAATVGSYDYPYGQDGMLVVSGGTDIGTTVEAGGRLSIYAGGVASSTTLLDYYNSESVFSGGKAISTFAGGGQLGIYSGGVASDTTLGESGYEEVYSGGSSISTTINSAEAGGLVVASGGTAIDTVVNDDSVGVDGTTTGTTVNGGYDYVYAGGTVIDTTVNSTGTERVFGGGTTSGTKVNRGGGEVLGFASGKFDALSVSTTVGGGGVEYVYSGNTASGTNIEDSGTEIVSSAGAGNGSIVNSGGAEIVDSGATANGVTVNDGGYLVIAPGGMQSGTTGAIVSTGVVVYQPNSGVTVYPDSATGLVVAEAPDGIVLGVIGGEVIVLPDGTAISTTVDAFGEQDVYGTATGTTVNEGGNEDVYVGGTAIGTTDYYDESVYSGGTTISTAVDGGTDTVHFYGVARSTMVNSGHLNASSGGTTIGTTVYSTGDEAILYGGVAIDTTLSGGTGSVASGGTAIGTIVRSGGLLAVAGDGVASGIVLGSGASALLTTGAVVTGGVVFAGGNVNLEIDGLIMPTISGFAATDTINLRDVSYDATASATLLSGNDLQITDPYGGVEIQLDPSQNFAGETFSLAYAVDNGYDGTYLTVSPAPAVLTISGAVSNQVIGNTSSLTPFSSVVVADPIAGQTETVTVTLSAAANGTLSNLGGGNYDTSTGVYTDTGTAIAVTTALDGLMFNPTAVSGGSGQSVVTTFAIQDTDTAGHVATDSTTSVITIPATLTITTLASFDGADGFTPDGGVMFNAAGDLVGTTGGPPYNGTVGYGTVYELANTGTTYASTPDTLASFDNANLRQDFPGVVADAAGDLFGVDPTGGGSVAQNPNVDAGSVYEIPYNGGAYASTPTTLATFNVSDGEYPLAGMITNTAGDLFGTTSQGGVHGEGTVFEIVNASAGYASTPTVLVSFNGANGADPVSGLIADTAGDLFGTTQYGGAFGDGTVFEIAKTLGGYAGTPTILVNFDGPDGADPVAGLVMDAAGNLFGTTEYGGANGYLGGGNGDGSVFELAKTSTAYANTPTTLVSFNVADGSNPAAGLIVDAAGDLFGTATGGGAYGVGTVFELAKIAGSYGNAPSTLVNFPDPNANGDYPEAGLTANAVGDLFGTTYDGGGSSFGDGLVFEISGSGFVGAVTEQGNTITATPQIGQTVSLNQLIANPSIVPTGTIQSLFLDGLGTVSVSGTASINDLEIGSGQLALSGATVNTDPVTVYANGDISGYGTITGAVTDLGTITANGGTLELTGSVTGIGTLVVDPGATLLLDLGTSSGAVSVNSGALIAAGELDVGETGLGGLLVENQATIVTGTIAVDGVQGLDISETAGGTGDAIVTGIGSLLDNTGEFIVGDGGLGSLSIQSGATVTTAPGTVAGLTAAVVANQSGAGGSSVNVTGVGSDWQVAGALDVGNAATGVLAITNGASVSVTTLDVGVGASGAGIVTVSGPDADLLTSGTVSVGDAGSGELSILDGANANIAGDLNIANAGTGTGNVDIEDTTGTITFGGNIWVGYNGFGVLNIGYGVDYIQNNGGINFGPDSSGAINSFADPSPFLSNSSPSPISIGAQGIDQLAAYLFNSGEFTIPNNHSLTFETPIISGGGSFALGSGDSLVLNADTVTGQTFTLGSNDKLTIGIDQLATIDLPASGTGPFTPESNPNKGDLLLGDFGGVIANFTSGDTIDVDTYLSSASAGTLSQNGSVVSVVDIANGDTLGLLTFDNATNAAAAVADNAIVLETVPCFAAGTRISTDHGEVAVEAIGIGDRVRVLLGEGSAGGGFSEVVWVGRREVDCAGHAQPRKVWPVRVSAGAFGPGRPHSDVWLSPDHAIYFDDVLIPIRHIINGSTIAQVKVDRITYHHIELAAHDVLLAEGLPAESFLDMRDGTNYANRAGPVRLYPDFSARMWEAFGCARLVVTGPELEAARGLVAGLAVEREAA